MTIDNVTWLVVGIVVGILLCSAGRWLVRKIEQGKINKTSLLSKTNN